MDRETQFVPFRHNGSDTGTSFLSWDIYVVRMVSELISLQDLGLVPSNRFTYTGKFPDNYRANANLGDGLE